MEKLTPRQWNGPFTRALIIENPSTILDDHLRKMGIEPHRVDDAPDEDELVRLLAEGRHQLLFKRSKVLITDRVVQASADLAAVMLCNIGDDSVDKDACARHGVLVTNDPISNGRSVAELVMGEIIAISRRLFDSVFEMSQGVWKKDNAARFEVLGKRLGIVGLGNIGRQVAQLGQALGMEIHFHDTAEVPREVGLAMGYKPAESLAALFEVSDFVSIHISSEDVFGRSNDGLFSYDVLSAFGRRPKSSPRVVLNLSRGFVIPPDDLLRAVQDGHVAYAITDVYPDEPGASLDRAFANPFAGEPRIFGTPHIGAATMEAQPRIGRYVARTTELLHRYGMLRSCVFGPRTKMSFEVPAEAHHMLSVVHVDKRGTKKAVDDAIYASGASNLRSAHIDFPKFGIAYDLSALDRPLTAEQAQALVHAASALTGTPGAIRYLRSIPLREPT